MVQQREGDAFAARQQWPEALACYRRALALCEKRAQGPRPSADWRRRLATVHGRLAWACFRLKDPASALFHFRAGRTIVAALVAEGPPASIDARELAWFDQKIADVENADAAE